MSNYICVASQNSHSAEYLWCIAKHQTEIDLHNCNVVVETICDHYVYLPLKIEKRQPNCPICLLKNIHSS